MNPTTHNPTTPGSTPLRDPAVDKRYESASSDEIRNDIDRTRAEMDRTVDALEDRLSPGRLIDDAWSAFKSGGGNGGLTRSLGSTLSDHPIPLALIGAGLGWLLIDTVTGSSDGRGNGYDRNLPTRYRPDPMGPGVLRADARTRGYASEYEPHGGEGYAGGSYGSASYGDEEGGDGATAKAKAKASEAADKARHAAGTVRDKAADAGHRASETMSDWAHQARRGSRRAKAGIWRAIDESPLAVGTVALAAGVLAGLSVPASEWEDEMMGEARDQALRKAKSAGKEALHSAEQVADRAVDAAARKADEEGWSTESLADSAREIGREAKEAAREEAKSQGATVERAARKVEDRANDVQRTGKR